MNETPALPPPDEAEPAPQPPPPTPRSRNLVPWVYALGFVVLALALLWVWQNPNPATQPAGSPRVETLAQQIQNLSERVAQLAQRPEPAPVNLAPLEQRVAGLEKRPVAAPDLAPIEQQVTALRAQVAAMPAAGPAPDLRPLDKRMDALEQQIQDMPSLKSELDRLSHQVTNQQAELDPRLTRLAADQQVLSSRFQNLESVLNAQNAGINAQVQNLRQQASAAANAAAKATRLAQIESARAALEAGQPVGAIADAPPAVARFATTNPPTQAALRLAFPAAAKAALDAAQPNTAGKPFGERLWQRAQQLITIREGDRVVVGNPADGVLARARQEVDAGDLSGAVASVSSLTGPAAQAMASWLDQAKALLAARAALSTMAAHA